MIKLDLHVINKSSTNWRDTMRAAMARRDDLEEKAREYEANTNVNIRPICLVQVERTGKEQRDGKLIHSEDVREYLIGQGVPKDWIAVKSAELDELKDFEDIGGLLARDCPIRYIITKHALQEGWDCSFAYVLAILTNPHSKTALTQLLGRILRQPYARKTHVPALDESYVYCFQRTELMEEIRAGFNREGLQGMEGRVVKDTEDLEDAELAKGRAAREIQGGCGEHGASSIRDSGRKGLATGELRRRHSIAGAMGGSRRNTAIQIGVESGREAGRGDAGGSRRGVKRLAAEGREDFSGGRELRIDYAYAAAHLLDTVPNPWIGYEFVERVFTKLLAKWKGREKVVANNLVFILEELRKRLEAERDRLAEEVIQPFVGGGQDAVHGGAA